LLPQTSNLCFLKYSVEICGQNGCSLRLGYLNHPRRIFINALRPDIQQFRNLF